MNWLDSFSKLRSLAGETVSGWSRYECTTLAAAISYYAALSIFPFVVVLISGMGIFFEVFETGRSAEEAVFRALAEVFSPEVSASVAQILEGVQTQARVGGPIAAAVLLYLSSRVFAQVDKAFEFIWEVKARRRKKGLRISLVRLVLQRLRSIALTGGFGVVVILLFFGSTVLYALESFLDTWFPDTESFLGLRSYAASMAASTLLFGGLYRILSRGPVGWGLSLGTGLIVAVLWEIGRVVLAVLVVGERYTALGVVGSFLGVMIWIFYSILALLAGAVLIRVIIIDHESRTG